MSAVLPPLDLSAEALALPHEFVPVEPDLAGAPLPEEVVDRVSIDVIHDGWVLPEAYQVDARGKRITQANLQDVFVRERDWGASLVAGCLASALHMAGFFRVTTARALLDFGRFPGSTPRGAEFLLRHAINYPFSEHLGFEAKWRLLEEHYDRISDGMDGAISGKVLKIGVHTYDERNPNLSRRPAVSLLTRSLGHHRNLEIPLGVFDPLFPEQLVEFTADRILRARISLALEEAAIHTEANYPYALPEGSVEVRSQVWCFFQHLRRRMEQALEIEGREDPRSPWNLVWSMLMDTNLRSSESELLRSYLHMYRRPPSGLEALFRRARTEYERVRAFLSADGGAVVDAYRTSVERTSSLGLEVRKDIVWRFEDGRPMGPKVDEARTIARVIAKAIQAYFTHDLPQKEWALAAQDPRFQ